MVPSPVTVATMPDLVPKDCTNPPLTLASTLLPNRCVHCPPTLTRLVLSVPPATVASNGFNGAPAGAGEPATRCHNCHTSTEAATSSRGDSRLIQPARP